MSAYDGCWHYFIVATHCSKCGMPAGGWPVVITSSTNTGGAQ